MLLLRFTRSGVFACRRFSAAPRIRSLTVRPLWLQQGLQHQPRDGALSHYVVTNVKNERPPRRAVKCARSLEERMSNDPFFLRSWILPACALTITHLADDSCTVWLRIRRTHQRAAEVALEPHDTAELNTDKQRLTTALAAIGQRLKLSSQR